MRIVLGNGWARTRIGLRDALCYGALIVMALVAGAAQAQRQTTAGAQQPGLQASQAASQQSAQTQESQPQTKSKQGSAPKISVEVKTVSVPVTVRDNMEKLLQT